MAGLKLAKLPDRTPVKITLSLPPELHRRLEDYADVYKQVHGVAEPITELVPAMLTEFLDGDRHFASRRRDRSRPSGRDAL